MAKEESGGFDFEGKENDSVFQAYPDHGMVKLKWATSALDYFDRFVIERSVDGQNFIAIIVILGKAFLSEARSHSSIDLYPLRGKSYYRLKLVYPDGDEKSFQTEIILP